MFGGEQKRPNLHIQDIATPSSCCSTRRPRRSPSEIFNVGYQNMSIMDIAETGRNASSRRNSRRKAPIGIETTPSNDNRSYHINSDKIRRVLGYAPKRTIEDAVRDLCRAFKDGKLPNSR